MMHLSRLSEEFILWSSSEFKFIELDDSHCTGSSIMPQKKNPDICELVRGKTGRFYGHLMGVLTMMKGIPMAYDKDMQEDKEGVFDAIDNLKFALTIYAAMIDKMTVNGKHMREVLESDFSNATDMADYLAKKGLPFREAHAVVGKAVHYCIEQGKVLQQLSLQELQAMSPLFAETSITTWISKPASSSVIRITARRLSPWPASVKPAKPPWMGNRPRLKPGTTSSPLSMNY